MPRKVALLIGVSQYGLGLPTLTAPPKDVEAVERVLKNPEMGAFDAVISCINPDLEEMQLAIYELFAGCEKEDLALLFFSGHGIVDDYGSFYLTTRKTNRNAFNATSVPASYVHSCMSQSRSKRQVIILDCCYSGAFREGWRSKSVSVDIKKQLGGIGRAVLTSSSATQVSFEQDGFDLSLYTKYLVEGIKTGAADKDKDGYISINELHEYAKGKVEEVKPAMKPERHILELEGEKILLAHTPISVNAPELKYREEVKKLTNRGEILDIYRLALNERRDQLGLQFEEAAAIEEEVLQPYQERKKNLQKYEQAFRKASENSNLPLNHDTREGLKYFQEVLGLRNEDIEQLEKQILAEYKLQTKQQSTQSLVKQIEKTKLNDISSKSPQSTASSQSSLHNSKQSSSNSIPSASSKRIAWQAGAGLAVVAVITGLVIRLQIKDPSPPPQTALPSSLTSPTAPVSNVTLTGAGASFPAPLYQRWFAEYNKQNPNVQISYQSVGSGAGVEQFTQGTVDFGASDTAMDKEEIAKVERGVVLLPMTAGAIVIGYNLHGVENLRLPREVYADIYLGNIKNWNDPRIAKANPDAKLPDQPITVVQRSDGSGITSVFTQHLSAISPNWRSKVGSGKTVDWPTGVGAKGNEGVTAQIQQTPGSIGYLEYGYAIQNNIPVATLENQFGNFVPPTSESAARTLEAVKLPENLVAFITDPEGEQSYPIVFYTWLLVYSKYQNQDKAQALKAVAGWALTEGQKYSEEMGYVPLPEQVVTKVESAINRITSN